MIYNKPIELFTILSEVVDAMRQTNTITSFTEVNGLYTLISDNTLSNSDYITIDSLQFKIKNVTTTQFQIKHSTGTDFLNKIWKANAPYFMHEKEAKAGEVLNEKTKQDTYKYQKYPLFLLVRPYTDSRDNQMIGYSANFNLYVITNTEQTYWSNDRVEKNFEPTLYPLYESFINKLIAHRYIKEKFPDKLNHSKTDLMFIDGNPFPDKMDGLNLSFTGLEVLKPAKFCEPVTPNQYNLTLETDGNGEIQPFEGTEIKNVNEIIAINATNNAGYRFSRWLINGIESVVNPTWVKMTNNINAIAEFISNAISDYYQFLPLGLGDNLTNGGVGGSSIDGLLISGSMATQDISFDWIRGNAWLQAVADAYGIDNPMTYEGLENLNGYNHPNNLKQLFLTEPIFENGELKDYSNTPVNAEIFEECYSTINVADNAIKSLSNPISFNWADDGLKYEFVTGQQDLTLASRLTFENGFNYGIRIHTNGGLYLWTLKSTSPGYSLIGFPLTLQFTDSHLYLLRIKTLNNIVTAEKAELNDPDYLNAEVSSIDLTTMTDAIFETKIDGINYLHGRLAYANLHGQEFYFNSVSSCEFTPAVNANNVIRGIASTKSEWQSEYTPTISGYTRVYADFTGLGINKIINIPYKDGVSRIDELKLNTELGNLAYEEFPNGEFGRGWGFKLNSQFEAIDIDNTYFNISSEANVITSKEQPTSLGGQVHYDNEIILHDTPVDLISKFNQVGIDWLYSGDSTASTYCQTILTDLTGADIEIMSMGGDTTATILAQIKANIINDPTYLSKRDKLTHSSGTNDYTQNVSIATFEANYRELIELFVTENPTALKIFTLIYDFKATINPTLDPDLPNGGGLTYNIIRQIITDLCTEFNVLPCDLSQASIIYPDDIPDGVHTYSNTGGKKCADKEQEVTNAVLVGAQPILIPTGTFQVIENDEVFTDWSVNLIE